MVLKKEQKSIKEIKEVAQENPDQEEKKRRGKNKRVAKGSRWTILFLFLTTLVVIGIFYFKTTLPLLWGKWSSPLVITGSKPEVKFDATLILKEIKNITQGSRGKYGFYVYRFNDKKSYGSYQSETFPAASLMKLPVILCFYQEVEKGSLSLETKYTLQEKDKVLGAGILQGKAAGSVYSYRQLIEYMGQYSDNTAFKVIRRTLGDEKIQRTIDDLEMRKTSLTEFETSPEDIGLLFQKVYKGEVISDSHQIEFLKFLTKTAYENWLPAGLPEDIKISHKIGKDQGTFSDGGIIFGTQPYILVVISKDAREDEANKILPAISSSVWAQERFATL